MIIIIDLLKFVIFLYLLPSCYVLSSNENAAPKYNTTLLTNYRMLECLRKSYDPNIIVDKKLEVSFYSTVKDVEYWDTTTMMVTSMIDLRWKDENFIWKKENYGGRTSIAVKDTQGIWKPEIYINLLSNYNTKKKLFHSALISQESGGSMQIEHDGTVRYRYRGIHFVFCSYHDQIYFPYLKKKCKTEFFTLDENIIFKKPKVHAMFILQENNKVTRAEASYGRDRYNKTTNSSVCISIELGSGYNLYDMTIHGPIMGISLLLTIPLWLSPANIIRIVLPTLSFLVSVFQMKMISERSLVLYSSNKVYMLDYMSTLMILSLLMLVHNFYCCLFWKRKLFLPSFLNKFYAKLYSISFYKKVTELETYFDIEENSENNENLEALFHTWSELLRVVDVVIFLIIVIYQMFFYVTRSDPT